MKKVFSLFLSVLLLLGGLGIALAQDGTYVGIGDSAIGGAGSIELSIVVENDKIVTATVTKNNDTPGISDVAIENIPKMIVELQTTNVDSISGATSTSNALKAAALDAIRNAGLDEAAWTEYKAKEVEIADDVTIETEIAIVGAGGAGLAAAVQANQLGAKVVVLEKMSKVGGNTILAGGALNAVNDRSEQAIAYNDSVEWHYKQTLSGGDYQGDPALVHTLVSNAWDGVQWLMDMGMGFQDETAGLFTVTGGLWPRAHKPVMPVGTGFFDTYNRYISEHDGVDIMFNTRATELVMNPETGRVDTVIATGETGNKVTVHASKGVIVATGGFSKNIEMRQTYNTQWADLGASILSTNHEGATGDGVKMMAKLGANFIQMGNIQLLPVGDPVTGSLAGNIEHDVETRIFVNIDGKRFMDEGGRRDDMTNALFQQPQNLMYIIMDSDTYPTGDVKNNFNETIDELVAAGRAFKGDTLEELAAQIGVSAENLVADVTEHNRHCIGGDLEGQTDEFGRTLFGTPIDTAPYYAAGRAPTVHHTMGGVQINTSCEVISETGKVIPGLYAAGEVTGGIHGTNRLGGNALTDTVVFGRIAAKSACAAK